jgi:hypothetical protein
MWDEQTDEAAEQTDEAAEPTAEDTSAAETEGAADADAEGAAAPIDPVDQQGADASGAVAAEAAPEVPDDARSTIARAQEHIDNLDMDAEREAAERTIKRT